MEYEGAKFAIPTSDITILPSLLNNDYEKLEFQLIKALVQPGMTFVDVGANIGIHSVIASRLIGEKGYVYSFEPEPTNFALLKANLLRNGCTNVTAVNVAVGDKRSKLKLYIESGSIGTHSLLPKNTTAKNAIEVNVIPLDEYFKGKTVDILKVDVEGFESQVLDGAKEVLRQAQCVFFEYNQPSPENVVSQKVSKIFCETFHTHTCLTKGESV